MASSRYDVPAVRKAIRLLELLGSAPQPMGVSEIARELGSNKNMTYRLLTTLESEGWVASEDPGPRYRVTLVPLQVASRPLESMNLGTAASEPMHRLWEELGESTYLGISDDDSVLYIAHLDSRQNVRIAGRVGARYPLYCTAPGKVLLAHAGMDRMSAVTRAVLPRFTGNTICDPGELRGELASVRDRGWAVDNEEYGRGLLCFAAAIFDHTGGVCGALGISVTTLSHTLEELVDSLGPRVLDAAGAINRRMGWTGSQNGSRG